MITDLAPDKDTKSFQELKCLFRDKQGLIFKNIYDYLTNLITKQV